MRDASGQQVEAAPIAPGRKPFVAITLASLAAPLLWVAHLAIVYLLEGFLRARVMLPTIVIPATIVVATLLLGAACGWLALAGPARLRRMAAGLQSRHFLGEVQRLLAGLSLLAILWGGAGVMFLGSCAFIY